MVRLLPIFRRELASLITGLRAGSCRRADSPVRQLPRYRWQSLGRMTSGSFPLPLPFGLRTRVTAISLKPPNDDEARGTRQAAPLAAGFGYCAVSTTWMFGVATSMDSRVSAPSALIR